MTDVPVQEAIEQKPERMVSQAEVERAIHAAKMHEREKAEARIAQMQNQGMGGMPQAAPAGVDRDAILEEAKQAMQAELDERQRKYEEDLYRQQVDAFARTYLEKMQQGPSLYEDFQDITQDISPREFPNAAILAGQMDNTAAVMYELAKNPQKLAYLEDLAARSKNLAMKEMTKLSQSIKANENAMANNQKSPSPLTKIKSSAMAGQDTGKRTVRDLRKDPRFRG